MGLGIGLAVFILSIAVGAYWFTSNRPKKVVNKPLTIVGVGLYVIRDPKTRQFQVTRIFPNSPAEKAGLIPGVILNKVDHLLAETNNIKGLSALLRGPVGSKVILETIDPSGATNEVQLTREQFVNHSGADPKADASTVAP